MPACAGHDKQVVIQPVALHWDNDREFDVDGAAIRGFAPKANKGGHP